MPSPRRKRLYEEIAEVLKKAILSGDYRVGDKLPSEMELAERFGVSRLVIREAIRYLELSGLIEVRQGATGGAFVRELDSKIIRQNLSDLLFFRKISVSQLYEVRMYVEPEVARLAALRRTEED
ncbi:MAG: FadR family transcriptional regulator, partial [Deltaproteobacteria bacterium]